MYTIIRVVGYFINKDGRCRYIILRLREIINKYTSENMAGVLIDLFHDYRIVGNIRYFIANNMEGVYKELARAYYKIDFKKVKKL